jgi:hypothetical protein
MDRVLDTINEDDTDLNTSSSETTGDNLPTVTPKQRSFADTVHKQNRDNKPLREKILRDKIATLQEELYNTVYRTGTRLQRTRSLCWAKPTRKNSKHKHRLHTTGRHPVQPKQR